MTTTAFPSDVRLRKPAMQRIGSSISVLVVMALLADAAMQLMAIPSIIDAARELGWPASADLWRGIGALLLVATILYAIPHTAFFGAILITGFLGGAIASHVRAGGSMAGPIVAALVLATLAWGGLWMRDANVRALARRA